MSKDKKEKYKENVDVLITHGEEALTFRKDDPTTQEYLNKKAGDSITRKRKPNSELVDTPVERNIVEAAVEKRAFNFHK